MIRTAEDKRARFVAAYLRLLNAREAAIEAGYSPKTATEAGSRLLADVRVTALIAKTREGALVKAEISQGRVLSELQRLAFSDVTDYTMDDTGNLTPAPGRPPEVMKAVSIIKRKTRTTIDPQTGNPVTEREIEFRLWDKPGTLKLAGRHVGLFPAKDTAQIKEEAKEMVNAMLEAARKKQAEQAALPPVQDVTVVDVTPQPKETPNGV